MIKEKLPEYSLTDEDNKPSVTLTFNSVEEREKACLVFAENGIRYRTGKTLVPFRLTGNIEWGVPAPALEGLDGLTVWVWPESLWGSYIVYNGLPGITKQGYRHMERPGGVLKRRKYINSSVKITFTSMGLQNGNVHGQPGEKSLI